MRDSKTDKSYDIGTDPRSSDPKQDFLDRMGRYAEFIDNSDLSLDEKTDEFRWLTLRVSYEMSLCDRRIPILLSSLERDAQKIDSRDSSKSSIYISRDLRSRLDATANQRHCSTNNLALEYLLDGLRNSDKESKNEKEKNKEMLTGSNLNR